MTRSRKTVTIPTFTYVDTDDPNVKRFVDRDGNWTHYWLVKEKQFVKAVNHVLHLGFPKGDGFMEYLKRTTPEEADRKLKTAGEEGARSHDAIKDLAAGHRVTMDIRYRNDLTGREEKLTADEWDNLQGYVNFCETYKPEKVTDDFVVYVPGANGFAGTGDALYTLLIPEKDKNFPKYTWGKRILALLDWKSSSKLWPEYAQQVSAYDYGLDLQGKFKEIRKYYAKKKLYFGGVVRIGTNHKCK